MYKMDVTCKKIMLYTTIPTLNYHPTTPHLYGKCPSNCYIYYLLMTGEASLRNYRHSHAQKITGS